MPAKIPEDEVGISNQVATLILVAVAVVGGAFAYTTFRNQVQSATGGKHVRVQSLDLTVVPPHSLFSVTVKNTGTESLDNVEVKLIISSGSWTVGSPPSFADMENSGLTENLTVDSDLSLESSVPSGWTAIDNVDDLQAMRDNLDGKYVLMNDIDATGTSGWNGGKGFDPIGDNSEVCFTGSFNGQGYAIENLFISRSSESYVGLFGSVGLGGVVENVRVVNENITGYRYVGGLAGANAGSVSISYSTGSVNGEAGVGGMVGHNNTGSVSNSYSASSVNGDGFVGGLIGYNEGSVSNCYSTESVTGSHRLGGLVGVSKGGSVSNCYSTGSVTGSFFLGGLIGYNNTGSVSNSYSASSVNGDGDAVGGLVGANGGSVSNCYSTGSVTGNGDDVGGLVAHNEGSVSNCYSTGSVTGNGDGVGGLVGFNNEGSVDNSFWDTQTSGLNTSAGGTGKTTENMENVRTYTDTSWSAGLTSPWDFVGDPYDDVGSEDIWDINPAVNGGYPHLETSITDAGYSYDESKRIQPSAWGTWTSTWKSFGETRSFTSLNTDANIPGASDVEVKVEVSDDGSSVKDSTGFISVKGSPTVDLEGLDKGRYARLSVKLERGSTPTVDSVALNYQGETTLSLGSVPPSETVSDSKQVSVNLHDGVEYVVRIVGYNDKGEKVLSKTMTVLSG